MKQAEVMFLSKGNDLNISEIPLIKFHNEYFGGGMSSIVFQEMRESKALAYSVYSTYTIPSKLDDAHYLMSYVGTQSDKLIDAMDGMLELLTTMPVAETNMENAREGIIQKIRTERLTKSQVLSEFEKANRMGIDYDIRKDLYSQVQDFTMNDLQNFHQSHINTENKVIMILGSKDELDLESIKKYGEIIFLSLEEVFGY